MSEWIKAICKWGPMHNGWTWGEVGLITVCMAVVCLIMWLCENGSEP